MSNPVDRVTLESFNTIGHEMGMENVAEFVENQAIISKLRELEVGYAIARPELLTSIHF